MFASVATGPRQALKMGDTWSSFYRAVGTTNVDWMDVKVGLNPEHIHLLSNTLFTSDGRKDGGSGGGAWC
jgi:hypothetical protein